MFSGTSSVHASKISFPGRWINTHPRRHNTTFNLHAKPGSSFGVSAMATSPGNCIEAHVHAPQHPNKSRQTQILMWTRAERILPDQISAECFAENIARYFSARRRTEDVIWSSGR